MGDAAEKSAAWLIINDGISHLIELCTSLERIWALRPAPHDEGFAVVSHPDVAKELRDFVYHFGFIALNVADKGPKRSTENNRLFQARLIRVEQWESLFGDIDVSVFADRRIRNSYVHADEHITRAIMQNPKAAIIKDLGVSNRSAFESSDGVIFVRVYEYATDTLLHLQHEFDVKRLYETAFSMKTFIG